MSYQKEAPEKGPGAIFGEDNDGAIIMNDFLDIYNKILEKNFTFSPGKNGVVATREGKRVKAEQLALLLEGMGWDDGVTVFLEDVATHMKATATPGAMRGDSQETPLKSPLIAARISYGEADRALLSHIRLVRTESGAMVLLYTGDGEVETYARVEEGEAAAIRRRLTHVPASPSYAEAHPGASRLDELTAALIDWCNILTREVQGAEPAVAVAARVVAQKCPYTLIRSGLLQLWTHTEGDGSVSHKVCDGFTLKGDWADVVAAQMDALWGVQWLYMAAPPILTNALHTPALHYIGLDTLSTCEGEIAAWDSFLRKMKPEEAEVFKAFVWSIFDAENRGRQLLYLMDEGYSGKSAVLAAIHDALGEELCVALSKESLNNQFAYSKIWNRRLVTIGDCKNPRLIRSQAMHSILGGDFVDVEYKGESSFSYKLGCRVIVASNIMLELDACARNEYSRILPIKITFTPEQMVKEGIVQGDSEGKPVFDAFGRPKFLGDQHWPKLLKAQFWAFLATCKEPYERLCPTHTDILMPDSCAETTASFDEDSSDWCAYILEKFLEITGREDDFVENCAMQQAFSSVVEEEKIPDRDLTYPSFKEFLRRRYSIEMKQSRKFGRKRGFIGCRFKEQEGNGLF